MRGSCVRFASGVVARLRFIRARRSVAGRWAGRAGLTGIVLAGSAVVAPLLSATPAAGADVSAVVRTDGGVLNERSGPSMADGVLGRLAYGSTVWVVCQRYGQTIRGTVATTPWWYQLTDGRYVTAAYLRFAGAQPIRPWCSRSRTGAMLPTVNTVSDPLNARSGPHLSSPKVGTIRNGGGITVSCLVWGDTITGTQGTTGVWNRLTNGWFVSDAYVLWRPATPFIPWCGQAPATVPTGTSAGFISMAVGPAQASMRAYKVPASVTIAQAILESGWAWSTLTRWDHNFFGMKCFGTPGAIGVGCRYYGTTECGTKGCYQTTDTFRAYRNDTDSYVDHGRALATLSRYRAAFAYTNNPDQFARELQKAGYATSPHYADSLISLMRQFNLYRYDRL
jgi:uncharacterized protein YraI